MALIKCTECGKEFSDKAPACPNCGCPTSEITSQPVQITDWSEPQHITSFDDVFEANSVSAALSKGAIKKARERILPNENVFFASIFNISIEANAGRLNSKITTKGKLNGVLVITNKRVMFTNYVLGDGEYKEISIKDITSVDSKNSFLGNSPVRICGLTEMFVVDCNSADQRKIMDAISMARQ